MFKDFLMKKMLKAQGANEEQVNMIITMMNKNPQLFNQIAQEIEEKIKQGKDKQQAAMEVMMAHQEDIKKLM